MRATDIVKENNATNHPPKFTYLGKNKIAVPINPFINDTNVIPGPNLLSSSLFFKAYDLNFFKTIETLYTKSIYFANLFQSISYHIFLLNFSIINKFLYKINLNLNKYILNKFITRAPKVILSRSLISPLTLENI